MKQEKKQALGVVQTSSEQPEPQPQKPKKLSRRVRYGAMAIAMTAIVVAAVLLCNLLVDALESRYPLTLDLTSDKTYSLSDKSVELAQKINKPVQIIIFTSESTFSAPNTAVEEFNTLLSQFYHTIQQYRASSNGRVTYEFVDLNANPTLATKYQSYGATNNDILFLCPGDAQKGSKERFQVISINDLYSYSADNAAQSKTFSSEVERIIATKINLVSADVIKKAALLTGHGELNEVVKDVKDVLQNNGCEVTTLNMAASEEPDEDVSVFLIIGPTSDYTTDEIARLRAWLDNDGKREKDLLVMFNYASRVPNLFELLQDQYGIEVTDEMVCETQAANEFRQNPYYAYADIAEGEYTQGLTDGRVLTPLTVRLKLHLSDNTENGTYSKPLVTFGDSAKLQTLSEAPEPDKKDEDFDKSLHAADEYPIVGAAYTTSRLYDNNDQQYYTTNVMVFGSDLFLFSGMLENVPSAQNEAVFLSMFRGLTGIESAIEISSRSLTQETLDFSGSLVPKVLAILFIGVIPVVLIATGIVVFLRRRYL